MNQQFRRFPLIFDRFRPQLVDPSLILPLSGSLPVYHAWSSIWVPRARVAAACFGSVLMQHRRRLIRMVGRDNACPLSSSRKDASMKHGFPYRRVPPRFPFGRPAGLANLVAGILLGVFIYRKGMEEGKKMAESSKHE